MFKIKKRLISDKKKPFIIAEMSGNHNGSLAKALKIVDLAAEAGVDAIKLQTYTPETITMRSSRKEFFIKDKKNMWKNNSLFDLYIKAAHLGGRVIAKSIKLIEVGLVSFSNNDGLRKRYYGFPTVKEILALKKNNNT